MIMLVRSRMFLFSKGRSELIRLVTQKMSQAAKDMNYEAAARYRDQIKAISGSLESQRIVQLNEIDRDVFGVYREGAYLQLTILLIRRGRMIGSKNFGFERQGVPDAQVLSTVCNLYYSGGAQIPDEVLVPIKLEGFDALAEHLTDLKNKTVRVWRPQKAAKRLLELSENASMPSSRPGGRCTARRRVGSTQTTAPSFQHSVSHRMFRYLSFKVGNP